MYSCGPPPGRWEPGRHWYGRATTYSIDDAGVCLLGRLRSRALGVDQLCETAPARGLGGRGVGAVSGVLASWRCTGCSPRESYAGGRWPSLGSGGSGARGHNRPRVAFRVTISASASERRWACFLGYSSGSSATQRSSAGGSPSGARGRAFKSRRAYSGTSSPACTSV